MSPSVVTRVSRSVVIRVSPEDDAHDCLVILPSVRVRTPVDTFIQNEFVVLTK